MFWEADQLLKLGIVVQAIEIGIVGGPIGLPYPAAKAFLNVSRASVFFRRTP